MSAGAAFFPVRNQAALTALAVSLALHLLAALLWVQERRQPAAAAPRTISILLQPPAAPAPPAPPPTPKQALPADPPPRPAVRTPPPVAQPDERRADAAPAAPSAPSTPSTSPAPGLDEARAPADVADVKEAIRDSALARDGFAAGLSKRQAGRIDRELRKGKSGVPDEPDTPMGRFRRGLEQAHVDRSMSVYEDSYTSPDGTIIYRKHIGNGTICRRSGNVSPLGMRRMLMGNEAGDIPCPAGVQWKRE
jgi:type IV secretory pathway VirB10-like protein